MQYTYWAQICFPVTRQKYIFQLAYLEAKVQNILLFKWTGLVLCLDKCGLWMDRWSCAFSKESKSVGGGIMDSESLLWSYSTHRVSTPRVSSLQPFVLGRSWSFHAGETTLIITCWNCCWCGPMLKNSTEHYSRSPVSNILQIFYYYSFTFATGQRNSNRSNRTIPQLVGWLVCKIKMWI